MSMICMAIITAVTLPEAETLMKPVNILQWTCLSMKTLKYQIDILQMEDYTDCGNTIKVQLSRNNIWRADIEQRYTAEHGLWVLTVWNTKSNLQES